MPLIVMQSRMREQPGAVGQRGLAADEAGARLRQVVARVIAGGAAPAGAASAPARTRRRESITAPRHGRDHAGAEQLAQRRDLDLQVVLLDHQPGPDELEQFPLGDDPVTPFDQGEQDVEGARAERGRRAADPQLPLGDCQLEVVEAMKVGHGSTAM